MHAFADTAGMEHEYLPAVTTVIIPAHNEARVIRRLLDQIVADATPGELDVIVVANGCTDDTADVADGMRAGDPRRYHPYSV